MSSPPTRPNNVARREHTKQGKVETEEKWFNEYPLPGDPSRPAVIITNLLSKSPRLIGWNDEEIEQIALDANPNVGYDDLEEVRIGPKQEEVNEVAFGLLGIAAKEVTKQLLQREEHRKGTQLDKIDEEDTLESVEKAALDAVSELSSDSTDTDADATMRNTELYQLALRSLLWQRDNYLVGREYADERGAERRKLKQTQDAHQVGPTSSSFELPFFRMPYDATALGNVQLVRLGSWFIPSQTVQRALLPIVVGLPTGPLNEPIKKATANLIPMSQNNLDNIVKSRVLWFLKDEHWRSVIKNSTEGYIANTYRDSS